MARGSRARPDVRYIGRLARALRFWRAQRDLIPAALAKKADLSKDTISRLEGGRMSDVSLGTLLKLQQALELDSIEQLLGGPRSFPSSNPDIDAEG